MPTTRRTRTFVVKISKFCNLRCSYCYEFEQLGQRDRMSLDQLRALFTHVRAGLGADRSEAIRFVWHGGEPFLIHPDEYQRIGEIQRDVFGPDIAYVNSVQTNLTVLPEHYLRFLRERRFFSEGIGVSFDVCGEHRVDVRGRSTRHTVLDNLQRLLDAGIPVGAIAVLTRQTVSSAIAVYRFYNSLGIPLQILPFYKSAFESQAADHALTSSEIASAFIEVFDAWLASSCPTDVYPLAEYTRYAVAMRSAGGRRTHDPERDEHVLLVDTNGDTYGVADAYDRRRVYGNLFRESLPRLQDSPARRGVVHESSARMARICAACPCFGYCPGAFVAEATAEQRRALDDGGCPVRMILTHVVQRIDRIGLSECPERPSLALSAQETDRSVALPSGGGIADG